MKDNKSAKYFSFFPQRMFFTPNPPEDMMRKTSTSQKMKYVDGIIVQSERIRAEGKELIDKNITAFSDIDVEIAASRALRKASNR